MTNATQTIITARRLLAAAWLTAVTMTAVAQGPNNTGKYYKPAQDKQGQELKTALFEIIRDPSVVSYDALRQAYTRTDVRPDGKLRDFYSSITAYEPGSAMASGNYEGYNYNREHSVCQSWFGKRSPMVSDIVHVIPTDGYVNSRRNNNPFGEVTDQTAQVKTSEGGYSKWGAPRAGLGAPAEVTTVFEPNDEVKGDIARIYMYMATCYENIATTFTEGTGQYVFNADGTAYQPLQQWVLDMMMRWSKQDPVDSIERARNDSIYLVQQNRNPFVDYPGLEDYVWGDKKETAFSYDYYEGVKQDENYDGSDDEQDEPFVSGTSLVFNNVFFGVDWTGVHPSGAPKQLKGQMGNVTILYAMGDGGSNMYCNANEIRLYQKNTLTYRVTGDDRFTKIDLSVSKNDNNKAFHPTVGEMDGYSWQGETAEVVFTVDEGKGNVVLKGTTITLKDIVTGIERILTPESLMADGFTYNLMGVRVDATQLQPGIYIRNGRKFVVR